MGSCAVRHGTTSFALPTLIELLLHFLRDASPQQPILEQCDQRSTVDWRCEHRVTFCDEGAEELRRRELLVMAGASRAGHVEGERVARLDEQQYRVEASVVKRRCSQAAVRVEAQRRICWEVLTLDRNGPRSWWNTAIGGG